MSEVSTFRLYLLRAMYLLIAVGLGSMIWPGILHHPTDLAHLRGVVRALLGSLSLLMVLGLRYPLKMLPLLFFELTWKAIWVLAFGLPLWTAHQLDPDSQETLRDCLLGVVLVPLVIPWRYVVANYVKLPGDRWTAPKTPLAGIAGGAGLSRWNCVRLDSAAALPASWHNRRTGRAK
jgi:hypothetical protein